MCLLAEFGLVVAFHWTPIATAAWLTAPSGAALHQGSSLLHQIKKKEDSGFFEHEVATGRRL
jgi:hypothetical protein